MPNMHIAVVNASKELQGQTSLVAALCAAWTKQLRFHVGEAWGYIPMQVVPVRNPPKGMRQVLLVDTPTEAKALGYAGLDAEGLPYGRVFIGSILEHGGKIHEGSDSVSAVGSHEILEMYGDWGANCWVDDGNGREYGVEICDPVEMSSYTISVDARQISVSNFAYPSWFKGMPSPTGQLDHLGVLKEPLKHAPGGFSFYREFHVDNAGSAAWYTRMAFGSDYPGWRKLEKRHPASRLSFRSIGSAPLSLLPQ
jgi:hypothetical protein